MWFEVTLPDACDWRLKLSSRCQNGWRLQNTGLYPWLPCLAFYMPLYHPMANILVSFALFFRLPRILGKALLVWVELITITLTVGFPWFINFFLTGSDYQCMDFFFFWLTFLSASGRHDWIESDGRVDNSLRKKAVQILGANFTRLLQQRPEEVSVR